jgi:hypothetical protein
MSIFSLMASNSKSEFNEIFKLSKSSSIQWILNPKKCQRNQKDFDFDKNEKKHKFLILIILLNEILIENQYNKLNE